MRPSTRRGFLKSSAAAAALAALALAGCSAGNEPAASSTPGAATSVSARTADQIKSAGTVRIGVFSDKAPFGYKDAQGAFAGYDIEYGNRIAQDLGVKAEYVPVEAATRVEFLETDKVDIILANFTVTPERAKRVDFVNPYMLVSLGAVSPNSAPVTQESQLADKKIVVVKGTTADTYLQEKFPNARVQKFEQYTEVTSALSDGRADVWVTDNTEALAWAGQNKDFSAALPSFGSADTIAAAVRKGNSSLLDWLNEELVTLGKEGFFHADFDKTLKPVYGTAVNPDDLVVEGGKVS